MLKKLLLFYFSLFLSGCFTTSIDASYGENVRLLPANTPVEVTKRYQKWYALWGVFPLTPSDTVAATITREGLVEARIYTEDSLEDAISGFFYVIIFPTGIIMPQTIVIEGNRSLSPLLKQSVFAK